MTIHPRSSHYSNTKFGWFLALVFLVLAADFSLKHNWRTAEMWAALCAFVALVTIVRPAWLSGPNRLWFALGELMAKVTNPIVMGVLFYLVITPLALVFKLVGRDALAMRKKNSGSFWIDREADQSTAADSFKHQF